MTLRRYSVARWQRRSAPAIPLWIFIGALDVLFILQRLWSGMLHG
jgi:hypothetical protein